MQKNKWILPYLVFALFLYSFGPFFQKLIYFKSHTDNIVRNDSLLFTPKSGLYVLPLPVQKILTRFEKTHSKKYTFYGTFAETQTEFYQRFQEGSWPARVDTSSRILIGYHSELISVPNIRILINHDNISLGIK